MPATSPTAIIAAFSLCLPPLLVLVPKAAVLLLLLAALAAAVAVWRRDRRLPLPDRALSLALLLLFAWSLAACLWTFEPAESLFLLLRLAGLMAAGLLLCAIAAGLDGDARRRVQNAMLAGFAVALVLVAVEGGFDQPIYGSFVEPDGKHSLMSALNRGATGLAILVWPATLVLRRGRLGLLALLLPALTFALLLLLESGAALAGLAVGALFAAFGLIGPRVGRNLLALAVVATVTLAPFIGEQFHGLHRDGADLLDVPSRHRLLIWSFTADRIAERPFFGWGFDASDDLKAHTEAYYVEGVGYPISSHPHNAVLQVWFELGAVGAIIALAVLLLLLWRLDRLPARDRWAAEAAYASAFVIALLSYGIWQNQWIAMLYACALVVVVSRDPSPQDAPAAHPERGPGRT